MICKNCNCSLLDRKYIKSKELCVKCNAKIWRINNIERSKEVSKNYYKLNKNNKLKLQKESNLLNPDKRKEIARKSYLKHQKSRLEQSKKYRQANPIKYCEYVKKYQKNNKEIVRVREKNYQQKNKHLRCHYSSKYRARKLKATPKWLTKSNIEEIKNIFLDCKIKTENSGIKHHVDHIIPLNSPIVCGLHVPWNLQIITEKQNCSKHNKLYLNNETSIFDHTKADQ